MNAPAFFETLEPDEIGQILGTGYCRFATAYGVHGLARVDGKDLHILAVETSEPGTGQFRHFIDEAKKTFTTVTLWEVWNEGLAMGLERYGFAPFKQRETTGEYLSGWRWVNAADEPTERERTLLKGIFEARTDGDSWGVLAKRHETSTGRVRYFFKRAMRLHLAGRLFPRVAA